MGDEIDPVASVDRKKNKENPAVATYYENMLKELASKEHLTPDQLKTHSVAAPAFNFDSSLSPSLSANVKSEALPPSNHPYGYNLFYEVYEILYARKEMELNEKEKKITEDAAEIYRVLDYLIQLRQRLRKEMSKLDSSGGKEPIIESIDFSLPPLKKEEILFIKKEKAQKSDLVVSDEFATVLEHHGYNVRAMKQEADRMGSSGSYVISFAPSVDAKTKAEFGSRIKECAALEDLQKKNLTEILTKEGKGRYNFLNPSRSEKKQLIQTLKDLNHTVANECEQRPARANQELAKLQPLQSAERLISEAMEAAVREENRAKEHISRNSTR